MLTRLTAIEHHALISSGKTHPSRIVCERPDGATVEVVAKFSAGCDEKESSLAREVIGACLAGDLGLPIPEPFLIDIPANWADVVDDATQRARIKASAPVAFGSQLVTGGYSVWHKELQISAALLPVAASVFAFDAIIQNVDRRDENPNCLVKGDQIRIFDHELAFTHGVVIGWQPPWSVGGLKDFETPGKHIFRQGLLGQTLDFTQFRGVWSGLSDARIAEYGAKVPIEWNGVAKAVTSALALIRNARDRIDDCLLEVKRVLT